MKMASGKTEKDYGRSRRGLALTLEIHSQRALTLKIFLGSRGAKNPRGAR